MGRQIENPYEWSTEGLLDSFMNVCPRAGVSGSGLVISISAGDDLGYAHYLRGVVKARIEGVKPPFSPGAQVHPLGQMVAPSVRNGLRRSHNARELPKVLTVRRVNYLGSNVWTLIFQEETDATADRDYDDDGKAFYIPLIFNPNDFEAVVPPTTTV